MFAHYNQDPAILCKNALLSWDLHKLLNIICAESMKKSKSNMENLTYFITYNIWQLIIYIFIYFLVYICHINLFFHSCSLCVLFVKTASLALLKWLVWLFIERNWMGWLTEDLLSYKNGIVAYIGSTSLETAINVWHHWNQLTAKS